MAAPLGIPVPSTPACSKVQVSDQKDADHPSDPSNLDGLREDYLSAEDFALACFNADLAGMELSRNVHSEIRAESETLAVTNTTITPVSAPEHSNVLFFSETEQEDHDFFLSVNQVENTVDFRFSREDMAAQGIHGEGESEISIESERVVAPATVSRSELNIESETMVDPTTASRSPLPTRNQEMQRGAQTFLVELSGNIGALVPLEDRTIYHEVDVIAGTMFGRSKYVTIKRSGCDFVKLLLDNLPQSLRELQEKGNKEITSTLSETKFQLELATTKIIKQDLEETGTTTEMLAKLRDHENNLVEMLDSVYFPMSLKLKKRADETFLSGLVSNLPQSLKDIQERNDIVVTLEEVKNEASKLIYIQLNGEKAAAHPPHIQSIPGIWRREHRGCRTGCIKKPKCKFCRRTCYPPLPVSQFIANYTGLWLKQVRDLFQNERKRKAPNDPLVGNGQLLKHFDEGVIEILRDWKANHPGKELPDGATLIDLISATEMDEIQIRNWFGNNAPGREKRNHPLKRRNTENI